MALFYGSSDRNATNATIPAAAGFRRRELLLRWITERPYVLPLMILVVGLLATLGAELELQRLMRADQAQQFARLSEQKLTAIEDRIDDHVALLRGAAGLFAAADDVTSADFRAYVERLLIDELYPGLQGIGFSRRLAATEVAGFEMEAQAEIVPDFRVRPEGPRSEYHSIMYLEPLDARNRAAIGFDMFTESVRRQAMEQARDTGQPVASGKVELVQEIDANKQPGFLIYLPIYRGGAVPETIEQRRSELLGFVYSPYRAGDLFASLFESEVDPQLHFAVYDGAPLSENLLYASDLFSDPPDGSSDARFERTESLDVPGRNWTVALASSPTFERGSARGLTSLVGGGGVLATLLLSALAWSQGRATRSEVEARQEVQRLNANLEERVVDRTIELREAQMKLRRMNASLEITIAERTRDLARANEEIQRFAYIVSHDLRAPLVNVMGFTSELEATLAVVRPILARVSEDDPAAQEARAAIEADMPEAIGFIRSSTAKMDSLINAILKLSREGLRTLTAERLNMAELLQAATDSVRHRLSEAGGDILVELPIPDVTSDRLALEQVFGNLIDNAVKYLDRSRPSRIVIRARETDSGVEYEVEDNGRGIAPADQERIFDLFRRAGAQDVPGEGIGLSHVRALVRRLGGDIVVESSLGKGTIFRVRLPRNLPVSGDNS